MPTLSFNDLLKHAKDTERPVILDGAMGTELSDRSVYMDPILWSGAVPIDQMDSIIRIHHDHVSAGAQIITTCTFRTTQRYFKKAGRPENQWRTATQNAVHAARQAATETTLVAGSMAPLEDCFKLNLTPSAEVALKEHALLATELAKAGVDVIWLETFGTRTEVMAAATSAAEVQRQFHIPFVTSLVTEASGNMLSGDSLVDTALELVSLGSSAICVNCVPYWYVDSAIDLLLDNVPVPIGVYANLGRPESDQTWTGDAHLSPSQYATLAQKWVNKGVSLVGGCCGSKKEHIEHLARFL